MPYTDPVVTYNGDGVEDTFVVPFPYINITDITATVDGVTATFSWLSDTEIQFDVAPAAGTDNVVIRRTTDIDSAAVTFTDPGALLADNLNMAVDQVRYSLQEAHSRIDTINGGGGGGGAEVPVPSAADRFIVSAVDGGGFSWQVRTVAQVQSLLGVGVIPSPLSGQRFIVTDDATNTYELKTLAETKTILGIGSISLPDPTGQANEIVVSNGTGTGYTLYTAAELRGLLGLGTAATKNTGTNVGNVVEVISGGSYGAALPALYGGYLTGVAKAIDYVQWARNAGAAGSEYIAGAWADVSSAAGLTKTVAEMGASAWSRKTGSNVLQLDAGTYYIKARMQWHAWVTAGLGSIAEGYYGAALRIHCINGTVNNNDFEGPIDHVVQTIDTNPLGLGVTEVEGIFKVTAGSTVDVQVQAQRYAGTGYTAGADTHTLGPNGSRCVIIDVWKLA